MFREVQKIDLHITGVIYTMESSIVLIYSMTHTWLINIVIIVFPSGGGIGQSIVQCGKEQENCEKIDHPQYMWISFMVIAQVGIYETLSFILKPNLFF